MVTGILGIDVMADFRDISVDTVNWEYSLGHIVKKGGI